MITESKNLGDIIVSGLGGSMTVQQITIDQQAKVLTGCQIDQSAQNMAYMLVKKGYQYQSRIVLLGNNSLEFLIAYLAILKTGATAVLINPRNTDNQITDILKDSGAELVLADRNINTDLPVMMLKNICANNMPEPKSFLSYQPNDQDVAVILYTSGSSGKPKGVLSTHKSSLSIHRHKVQTGLVLIGSSMCANSSLRSVESCLWYKNSLVFLEKFDAKTYLQAINDHKISKLIGTPAMLLMLTKEQNLLSALNLDCVTQIILSGAPATEFAVKAIADIFKKADIKLAYGSTEGGYGIFGGHPTLPTPPGSVGYPAANTDYRLIDGVLQIRGPGVMKGYTDQSQSFTTDGYYITNDIFRVDQQGFYYYVARSDDMFKSGGNKIFPIEIEQVIDTHPLVLQSVVVPVDDLIKGSKPCAFVCLKYLAEVTAEEIKLFLSDKLAHYLIPRQIWIVDNMPINSANKIDRQQLISLAQHNLQTEQQGRTWN
jgi:long-chain acyl-CoA synthetase